MTLHLDGRSTNLCKPATVNCETKSMKRLVSSNAAAMSFRFGS